jgi:hypothetical protein
MTKLARVLISSIIACIATNLAYADNNSSTSTSSCMSKGSPATYTNECSSKMQGAYAAYYNSLAPPATSYSTSDYTSDQNTEQAPRLNNFNASNLTASNPKFIIKPLSSISDKKKLNTTIKWF